MLAGWNLAVKNGAMVSTTPAHRWPWQWTYALMLERRWEYIAEMSAAYGDEDGEGDDREIPPEIWHDRRRVNDWIERMKRKRKERNESGGY